jgi:hypothetical protein
LVAPGGAYFPWNYARRHQGARIGRRVHVADRGCHAFNALDSRGRVVGSALALIAPRASARMISTEEFAYGGGNGSRGPYLWSDEDHDQPWIIALLGLWTRPSVRRQGVARRVVMRVAEFGLPVYVAFGNPYMDRWFNAELSPSQDELGDWQEAVYAFMAYAEDPWIEEAPGGCYQWQLELTATRRLASGMLYGEAPTLGELLFRPRRATWYELDGGAGEADLSDTPFAQDRRYGYELRVDTCDDLDVDVDFEAEAAEDLLEQALDEAVTLRAEGELMITNSTVLKDYAAFRRMLRTGEAHPAASGTEADTVHELLVASHEPAYRDFLGFAVRLAPSDGSG